MAFKDIKGQDRPIGILKERIRHSRLCHAYLFTGPEGVGKNLTARTLAKTVNCQDGTTDSCDNCPSCINTEKNQHPDVHSFDTETSDSIKIEDIRLLQKEISLKPYEGRKKVFVVDNAHALTAEAGNAILKILEEPPQNSLIILVSAKPALLFKTILSRCCVIKFYPMPRRQLNALLKEDYRLDDNLAHFLAYFCEGRLGYALRLKDTDILNKKNRVIDEFIFSRLPKYKDKEALPNKGTAFAGGQNTDLERASIQKEDLRSYLNILAGWFRDIYLIKTGHPHGELINLDRKKELLECMNRFSFLELDDVFDSISNSFLYLEQNINIKLLLYNLNLSLVN